MSAEDARLFACYRPVVTTYVGLLTDKRIPEIARIGLLVGGVIVNAAMALLPPPVRERLLFWKRNERTRRIANSVTGYVFLDC
jgi:uncharacterized protein (DUF2236 family)